MLLLAARRSYNSDMIERFHTPRVAILASGGGTTAEAFIHATQDGTVDAEVGLVVCNNPPERAGVYDRIAKLNAQYGLDIETRMINGITHPAGPSERGQTDEESAAIRDAMDAGRFDHVALMGYMKRVRGDLVEDYGYLPHFRSPYYARMSNTHPGPLPESVDTYGIHTQERVLELGMELSRHTLHLVSAGIDLGPKIAEHPVVVLPGDTPEDLFKRVQQVEKAELPGALDTFLKLQRSFFAE